MQQLQICTESQIGTLCPDLWLKITGMYTVFKLYDSQLQETTMDVNHIY